MNISRFAPLIPAIASLVRAYLISRGAVGLAKADEVSLQIASGVSLVAGIAWGQFDAWKKHRQAKQPTESNHENSN